MEKLIELMQQQIALQNRRLEEQERDRKELLKEQERRHGEQERRHEEQMKVLREIIDKRSSSTENKGTTSTTSTAVATPNFTAFDSPTELWSDYWSKFCTFSTAHSVPESKKPKVFLQCTRCFPILPLKNHRQERLMRCQWIKFPNT